MLNALWVPLTFQDTALMTIAVPAATVQLAPANHVFVLSGARQRRGARRNGRAAAWAGGSPTRCGAAEARAATFVAAGLVDRRRGARRARVLARAGRVRGLLVVATVGANVALCAYQVLLPESVPRAQVGASSRACAARRRCAGTVLGFAHRGRRCPIRALTFLAAAAIMALGGLSLFGIGDGQVRRRGTRARARLARFRRRLRRARVRYSSGW